MIVKRMDIFKYDSSGWNCRKDSLETPTWTEIEVAIRQLDRHSFPFIWLHTGADPPEDEPPFVSVMGGQGAFLIEGYPEGKHFIYYDDTKGDEEVMIWTSDQGYEVSEKNLCYDIDEALKVVKHICESGNLPPDYCWKRG